MRKDKSDLIARATTARDTLKSMGFKQNFVAEKIGISQTELSKMLNLDFYYVTEAYLDKLEAFIAKHKVDSHA
jgi:predicted XRE-type DNA-binding protein